MSLDLEKENGFTLKKPTSRWYPVETTIDADYTDDLALRANLPVQPNLWCIEWRRQQELLITSWTKKTEFMCFYQDGAIFSLQCKSLKLADQFIYFGSNILSTESDFNKRLSKARRAFFRLLPIWKSGLSDKTKREFFQAVAVSVLLHGCTTYILT